MDGAARLSVPWSCTLFSFGGPTCPGKRESYRMTHPCQQVLQHCVRCKAEMVLYPGDHWNIS